jgi:uncharacterized protein (TIGR03435 family)
VTSARYEINAKADAPVDSDQLFLMLRSLLEERFLLKTHREIRELPVFALVAERSGLRLPAPKDGVCVDSPGDAALEWRGGRMAVQGELAASKDRCGAANVTLGPDGMQLHGSRIAISELARALSMLFGRGVIDKTGFSGLFDLRLVFIPDDETPGIPPPSPGASIMDVSLSRALQEQLGLGLQRTTGPVEMIVVDSIERPSVN